MSTPKPRRRASRRAFLKTIAAGSAAALAAPALSLAAEDKAAKATTAAGEKAAKPAPGTDSPPPRPPEIEKGIAEQKAYLKQSLEAIRGFELPTNSEQAFTFAPMASPRGGRRP